MAKFGVEAAKNTAKNILRWKLTILDLGIEFNIPPSVIAAIISRETLGLYKWCQPPPVGVMGDSGHGAGPMQIDSRSFPAWHNDWKAGKLKVEDGIRKGCQVLNGKLLAVDKLLPAEISADPHRRLFAAVSAYNVGEYNVRKAHLNGKPLDAYTTNHNYATDVLERAAWFKENGFPDPPLALDQSF